MTLFPFRIETPSGVFIEGRIAQLEVRTYVGSLGIMAKHEPIVAACPPGKIRILQDGEWIAFAVSRAILVSDGEKVKVMTSLAKLAV